MMILLVIADNLPVHTVHVHVGELQVSVNLLSGSKENDIT